MTVTPSFWAGRRVLVTGHTGFKGGWLSVWLQAMGAHVTGISLPVDSHLVDLLDRPRLEAVVRDADPQIVFHLAAQSLVLPAIEAPVETFATNVVGTAALLAACGQVTPDVVLVVTSDKVYANDGAGHAFVEGDTLGGGDPYSASKAAVELVVASWRHTYLRAGGWKLATARAGNVIGGGDVSGDRLLPDVLRAFAAGRPVELRNPGARRPWQFVLDPLAGYLAYAEQLATVARDELPLALNFGPDAGETLTVAEIADLAIRAWGTGTWERVGAETDAEAPVLTLDATLARSQLGWAPVLGVEEAVQWTVDWLRHEADGGDLAAFSRAQLQAYRARAGS